MYYNYSLSRFLFAISVFEGDILLSYNIWALLICNVSHRYPHISFENYDNISKKNGRRSSADNVLTSEFDSNRSILKGLQQLQAVVSL